MHASPVDSQRKANEQTFFWEYFQENITLNIKDSLLDLESGRKICISTRVWKGLLSLYAILKSLFIYFVWNDSVTYKIDTERLAQYQAQDTPVELHIYLENKQWMDLITNIWSKVLYGGTRSTFEIPTELYVYMVLFKCIRFFSD